jgi:metal-responsive CopG/Arc/MetJ family transcriptional regulator
MSKRVTVSLPDDLGDALEKMPAGARSSYVAAALRDRMEHETRAAANDQMLREAGYVFTDEGLTRMRNRLRDHQAAREAAHAAEQRHAA